MIARELMSAPPIVIRDDETIETAVRLMIDRRLSGLPVVDANQRLIGMVTEGDLLRRTEFGTERKRARWLEFIMGPGRAASDFVQSHGHRISEVMTDKPIAIGEDTSVTEIVDLMEKRHIKRLPVVRDEAVVGVVSRADVIRGLADQKMRVTPASDAEIRDRILADLKAQRWAPVGLIGVAVDHGEVHLSGAILDERERDAIRVLAENAPGVSKVHDHLVWVGPEGVYVEPPPDKP